MAAASFEAVAGGRVNEVFSGPWAWFRLIETARTEQDSQGRFVLTFTKGGHRARVRIEPDRARNPYATRDFQKFRCG
jgi:type VI secretion system protein ImpL